VVHVHLTLFHGVDYCIRVLVPDRLDNGAVGLFSFRGWSKFGPRQRSPTFKDNYQHHPYQPQCVGRDSFVNLQTRRDCFGESVVHKARHPEGNNNV
jgi:hypothetical protein